MTIRLLREVSVEDARVFETLYEDDLQMDDEEKAAILDLSSALWLTVDGVLVGETYGLPPAAIKEATEEEIEDCDPEDASSIYCYSTSILPQYQGSGYGRLLKAAWLGCLFGEGEKKVIGHATSPAAVHLNELFGATFGAVHEHWYGTDRTAHFYTITL